MQRPDYEEDDRQLKGDMQWHLQRRELYKDQADRILRQVIQISPDAKTLLDVGCGLGTTVLISRELGFTAQGIEPNPYAVRYAKENLSLDLIQAYFSADLFDTKFDVMIVDNVLEHITSPRAFIKEVFSLLNKRGILYLAVPDRRGGILRIIYSLLFPRNKFSLFLDNDVHINQFSQKSILKLIEPYGATLLRVLRSGEYIIQAKA